MCRIHLPLVSPHFKFCRADAARVFRCTDGGHAPPQIRCPRRKGQRIFLINNHTDLLLQNQCLCVIFEFTILYVHCKICTLFIYSSSCRNFVQQFLHAQKTHSKRIVQPKQDYQYRISDLFIIFPHFPFDNALYLKNQNSFLDQFIPGA